MIDHLLFQYCLGNDICVLSSDAICVPAKVKPPTVPVPATGSRHWVSPVIVTPFGLLPVLLILK